MTHHLVDRPESKAGHQFAHFLGDEAHECDDMRGVAFELRPKLRVLSSNTHRASIQMADAHHYTAHCYQGGGCEPEFFRPEQSGDNDVAPGLELAIYFDGNSVPELVQDKHLMCFRQAQLPWNSGVGNAGKR